MPKQGFHLKHFILFQLQRQVVNLYKKYIISTEDLKRDHIIFLNKLKESGVSEELLNKLDYFTDDKYTYIRKKILDSGNEAVRDMDKYFELLDVELNEKAIEKSSQLKLGEIIMASKNTKVSGNEKGNVKVKGKLI
tara:strand:+ start:89 stop:496 length:408 start_codon:yes stop_codon:yes gene_type:complete